MSGISDADEIDQWFEVSLIPETLTATTLGDRVVGDSVNIETDILARHAARILALTDAQRRRDQATTVSAAASAVSASPVSASPDTNRTGSAS